MRGFCALGKVTSDQASENNTIIMLTHYKAHPLSVMLFSLGLALLIPLDLQASDAITGSAENGKVIALKKCDRCHGPGGVSDDADTPHLAMQSAAYLLKQMKDYKARARKDINMYKRVRKLDDQQMDRLTAMPPNMRTIPITSIMLRFISSPPALIVLYHLCLHLHWLCTDFRVDFEILFTAFL